MVSLAQLKRQAEDQSMKALQDRREKTRQEFFKGREDISDARLDKRQIQKDLYEKFKKENYQTYVGDDGKTYTKDLSIRFDTDPMSPTFGQYTRTTLADKATELAMKYGPTLREIGSDMGYAIGSMAKGAGDFIGKGGVVGNVLSGLYDKFKGETQQGIETVEGLYDNLRTTLSGQPTVTYGGGSTMVTTSDGQPRVDFTPTSIDTEELPAMNLSKNVGDESDPSIFGIDNAGVPLPYKRSTIENPNLINVLPQGGGYLPEGYSNVGIVPIVPEYYDPNNTLGNIYLESIGVVPEGTVNSDLRSEASPIRVSDIDVKNLTAENLIDPTIVGQTVSDYYDAALRGIDVNTPIGNLNLNPMAQKIFLDGKMGNINYGGSFDPNTYDYNVGIGTQLPYGVNFSAGASSSDIPGMSFSKNIGPVNTSFNLSEQGGSLGLNTVVDPLRTIFPGSSIGTPINIGASVDSRGNIIPNVGFMVPFKDGGSVDKYAGLGYKLK